MDGSDKITISGVQIEERIFTFREVQVMVDRDLAEMYQVGVKRLNEQVKRNIERFPPSFLFQLNDAEKNELVANCDRLRSLKHSTSNPYVFTEQGVAMLSAVLRSSIAIKVSIQIMRAFVQIRKLIGQSNIEKLRLSNIENKLGEHDKNFEKIFKALENKDVLPTQGIFFNGQVFEAHKLISDIVRSAEKSIILIDNFIDDTVLTLFSKRKQGVELKVLTKNLSKQLRLDIQKFNEQFPPAEIKEFVHSHDRFLIIDNCDLYHLGASLKDLGKKWFGFSKMELQETMKVLSELG